MRGNEFMAFKINEIFLYTIFLYTKEPKDIKPNYLNKLITVILVNSVINTKKTVIKFIK